MGMYDRDWYREAANQRSRDEPVSEQHVEGRFRGKKKPRQANMVIWILLIAPWVCLLVIGKLWIKDSENINVQRVQSEWSEIQSLLERFHLTSPMTPNDSDTNRQRQLPTTPSVLHRPDQSKLYREHTPKRLGVPWPVQNQGKPLEFVIHADSQGHYRTVGTINGRQVNFLLDTGATFVSVPERLRWQLNLVPMSARRTTTASDTYTTAGTIIDELGIGSFLMKKIQAGLNPRAQNNEVLLGMSALKNFELVQRNGTMTLRALVDYEPNQTTFGSTSSAVSRETIEIKRSVRECLGTGKVIDQRTLNCMRGN